MINKFDAYLAKIKRSESIFDEYVWAQRPFCDEKRTKNDQVTLVTDRGFFHVITYALNHKGHQYFMCEMKKNETL